MSPDENASGDFEDDAFILMWTILPMLILLFID